MRFPPDVASLFGYTGLGEIVPTGMLESDHQARVADAIHILNLQAHHLQRNRAAVLKSLRQYLDSKGWGRGNLAKALREARTRDANGELAAYAGVVEDYLERKLRQHS